MADADSSTRVLLMGPPGCGKGTQAERLSGDLGVPAISTGDMLRASVRAGSTLGRRVESVMKSGRLVDDATMADVVRARLENEDVEDGFILDGYPRTLNQARTLAEILEGEGSGLDAVLYLEVPEEELLARARGRGREDDATGVVRRRLEVYREQTEPVLEFYRDRDLLVEIDGDREIPEVTDEILRTLGEDR